MDFLSVCETAKKWQISERSVRNYCAQGRIIGAVLNGNSWLIPASSTKPQRKQKISKAPTNLLARLKLEQEAHIRGGIYHRLQIDLTYNSNHMEGSRLTHDQTRYIYETKTIGISDTNIKVDDIIETVNHFRCIDLVIDAANYKLSESFIKQLHFVLKTGTSDAAKPWFKVGDYKALPNEVGEQSTTNPKNVKQEMTRLLSEYNSKVNITIEDIIEFHKKFESIHPFQDGNGRVGRLIMFKECLRNNFVPIIILDEFKEFYYRGLKEWKNERGYLIDTCLHGQDIVKTYLDYFHIKY